MKYFFFSLFLFLAFTSCKKDNSEGVVQGKNVAGNMESNYHVDIGESTLNWRMTLTYDEDERSDEGFYGTVQIKSGTIKVISDLAVLAEFFTDPGTFVVDYPGGSERDIFVNELEESSLFNERGFLPLQLTLHHIQYTDEGNFNAVVGGLMDLNGTINPVSFRANLNEDDNLFYFNSEEFEINSSEFGVEIPSEDGTQFKDEILMQLDVTAKK